MDGGLVIANLYALCLDIAKLW